MRSWKARRRWRTTCSRRRWCTRGDSVCWSPRFCSPPAQGAPPAPQPGAPSRCPSLPAVSCLQIAVKTPQDLAFKTEVERQYLILNLMAGGRMAYEAGDFARAAHDWEVLLKVPSLPPEVARVVLLLLAEAQRQRGGAGAPSAPAAPGTPAAAAASQEPPPAAAPRSRGAAARPRSAAPSTAAARSVRAPRCCG